jgi:ABC-2 type transport system permease protein
MNIAALTLVQMRYVNKAFWRNPASAFFTFAFPLMFLVIFTALLGGGEVLVGGRLVHQSTYYVAAMGAFSVITACYNNTAVGLTFQRDAGVLKRTNGTPLPSAVFFTAKVLHALLVSLLLVAITVTFGKVLYQAEIPTGAPLFRFLVILMVGAASFCALGFAITAVIPNADAASPIVNATILPLLFLSGIFIPIGKDAPGWIKVISNVFPVRHFFDAMSSAFLGNATVSTPGGPVRAFPFDWADLAIVAVWGIAGLVLAARYFSWEPRK